MDDQLCRGLPRQPSKMQIRHSKSEPLINSSSNGHKWLIDKCDSEDTTDASLFLPHWFSSASLSSVDSTISAEDLIHEMVTIEGLRTLYTSCFACGVSWHQNHVTLDCRECGGYAMSRPCPECDGKCDSQWQRNLTESHDRRRAVWTGECKRNKVSVKVNEFHETTTQGPNRPQLIATLKV